MKYLAPAVLALAATTACTATATITDGVCGNGVLEPGEDCDSPDTTVCTSTCLLVCSVDARGSACTGSADGTCCPTGFVCGVDSVCHAPSGSVIATTQVPFNTAAFLVSDIDGDLLADALGIEPGTVEAAYGDTASPMSRTVTVPAPTSNRIAFG